jgi:hypothetical protein
MRMLFQPARPSSDQLSPSFGWGFFASPLSRDTKKISRRTKNRSETRNPGRRFASTGVSKPGDVSLTWDAQLPFVQASQLCAVAFGAWRSLAVSPTLAAWNLTRLAIGRWKRGSSEGCCRFSAVNLNFSPANVRFGSKADIGHCIRSSYRPGDERSKQPQASKVKLRST